MGRVAEQVIDNLLESIKMITDSSVEKVQFDKTIEAIIEDASEASSGRYLVSYGNLTFYAFSVDATYKKNDAVYVMVPQGNFDNQKIILSKRFKDNETIMTYESPLNHLIDITQNLITSNIEESIWANSHNLQHGHPWNIDDDDFAVAAAQISPLWSWSSSTKELSYSQYTKLGISAEFATYLNTYGAIEGNYGLALNVVFSSKDFVNSIGGSVSPVYPGGDELYSNEIINNESTSDDTFQKTFILDSSDFYGNPYGFETYFTQEILFDISDFIDYHIVEMSLYLYQRNNFYDASGELILTLDENSQELTQMLANIYVKNPYICLGYDIDSFDNDIALLYSYDSSTYYKTSSNDVNNINRFNNNQKTIYLRWIHKDEKTGKIKMMQTVPTDYEIRWYRHVLGVSSSDQFAGAYYERITLDEQSNSFALIFNPDINFQNEILKVAVIKRTEVSGGNIKESLIAMAPTLTFTNSTELPNLADISIYNALNIRFEDNYRGRYYVYGQNNKILNSIDTKETRYLTVVFDPGYSSVYEKALLVDCDSIYWYIPKENTMISVSNDILNAAETLEDSSYVKYEGTADTYYGINSSLGELAYQLPYTIKSSYNRNYINNTIRLEVVKDGLTYTTSADLQFGIYGTAGYDYSVNINWVSEKNVLDVNRELEANLDDPNDPVSLYGTTGDFIMGYVVVYDPLGLPVSVPPEATITYSWMVPKQSDEHIVINSTTSSVNSEIKEENEEQKLYISSQNNYVIISCNPDNPQEGDTSLLNKLHILQININNFLGYNLVYYFPIPLKNSVLQLEGIDGATYVRYGENGKAEYNSNPYKIFYNDNGLKQLTNVIWCLLAPTYQTITGNETDENLQKKTNYNKYFPKVTNAGIGDFSLPDNILKPVSMFVQDAPDYGVQCILLTEDEETHNEIRTVIWSQPILVYQSTSEAIVVSTSGGDGLIINEDYTIENITIATGQKEEEDNSYSGMVVGDLVTSDETTGTQQTVSGVFGFSHGQNTYGFNSKGAMYFNGKEQSSGSGNGVKTYFSFNPEGRCHMQFSGRINNNSHINTNMTFSSQSPYFSVFTNNYGSGNLQSASMIHISDDNNFLQSKNFSTVNQIEGSKINLNDGEIESYNYKFESFKQLDPNLTSHVRYGSTGNYPLYLYFDNNTDNPVFYVDWRGRIRGNIFQNSYCDIGILDTTDEENIKVGIDAKQNTLNLIAKEITLTEGETADNPEEISLKDYIVSLIEQHVDSSVFVNND